MQTWQQWQHVDNNKTVAAADQVTKIVVQVNDCLANAGDFDKAIDYSMRQDAAKVLQNGKRIAQCMARCDYAFAHCWRDNVVFSPHKADTRVSD